MNYMNYGRPSSESAFFSLVVGTKLTFVELGALDPLEQPFTFTGLSALLT